MSHPDRPIEKDLAQELRVDVAPPSADDEIDLFEYLEVVMHRRWLIFWGAVLCALAPLVYLHFHQKSDFYRSQALILPEAGQNFWDLQATGASLKQSPVPDIRQVFKMNLWLARTFVDILKSYPLNRKVVQKTYQYTLDGGPRETNLQTYFGVKSQPQAIDALLSAAKFDADQEKGVLSIAVETRSPQLSAAVANEYIRQLIAYQQDKRQAQIQDYLSAVEQRTSEIQKDLKQAQEALTTFRRQNRNLGPNSESTVFLTPKQQTDYSQLQQRVKILSSLLSTVMDQYEISRLQSKRQFSTFEVLNYAQPSEAPVHRNIRKYMSIGFGVGMMASVFLAFFLEYLERGWKSGRLEPSLKYLRQDTARVKRWLQNGDRKR